MTVQTCTRMCVRMILVPILAVFVVFLVLAVDVAMVGTAFVRAFMQRRGG